MFSRAISETIKRYTKFPAIALLGPRQSGKTTLAQLMFPQHKYLSFDKDTDRVFAQDDPEHFLKTYENEHGIILDEFQYVPRIVSYIKLEIDAKKRPGYFILSGSQNFLALQAITESLAGRVGILNLLPLSLQELESNGLLIDNLDNVIFEGGYPRLYQEKFSPLDLYPSYIQSYVERDVRQLINAGNISLFQRFIQLCAGRVGQLLNLNALGNECGISFPTARQWLSILEASYIVFTLQPHFQNFNKRVVKTPKLYFYDTGLACSLLRIQSPDMLAVSPFRGALFENLIIGDLYKQYCNCGIRPPLYFWRGSNELYEIDCILDEGNNLYPVEIKSGQTIATDFFKGLSYWNNLAHADPINGYLIYGGSQGQQRTVGNVLGWREAAHLIDAVKKK